MIEHHALILSTAIPQKHPAQRTMHIRLYKGTHKGLNPVLVPADTLLCTRFGLNKFNETNFFGFLTLPIFGVFCPCSRGSLRSSVPFGHMVESGPLLTMRPPFRCQDIQKQNKDKRDG